MEAVPLTFTGGKQAGVQGIRIVAVDQIDTIDAEDLCTTLDHVIACRTPGLGIGNAVIARRCVRQGRELHAVRSEEHTSELQSLMRISYAVFCLKKKKQP